MAKLYFYSTIIASRIWYPGTYFKFQEEAYEKAINLLRLLFDFSKVACCPLFS